MEPISDQNKKMRKYFESGATLDYRFRKRNLELFSQALIKWEKPLEKALYSDLRKSPEESYMSEISMVKSELSFAQKNLKRFMKKKKVPSPIIHFPSKSYRINNPLGLVLIMSPWNYPVQLTLSPLVAAIAAGNCAILKPSRYSSNTSKIIKTMIQDTFDDKYVTVFEGGSEVNQQLLNEKFDFIFFTGSPTIGHIVMEKASKYLTPIALELGGKSPVYVDKSANIKLTAERLAWGKYLNSGQTCVAPDYILCHKDVSMALITSLKSEIIKMYGSNPVGNDEYPKIINEKHYNRLVNLLKMGTLAHGGQFDSEKMKIAPSIMVATDNDSELMSDEIFGPILPIINVDSFEEAVSFIQKRPHPLACYLFTNNRSQKQVYEEKLIFGGGCINDCVVHLSCSHLPFGGIGDSGMGSYHGMKGLESFSHSKSILKRYFFFNIKLRNPPYKGKMKKLKRLL
jgi:aldehyde dehydrogenase (NAD+)